MSKLQKNKKGQIMIIMALGIVLIMIQISSLIGYAFILRTNMTIPNFRNEIVQISHNFRTASAIALSQVTQEIELKSSAVEYDNYTNLEEYPEAANIGINFMTDWQNQTHLQYGGKGLNLDLSNPAFDVKWSSPPFFSRVNVNLSFDIAADGFEGWQEGIIVETRISIIGLDEHNGNTTSFFFRLTQENGLAINNLDKSSIKILYNCTDGKFRKAESQFIKLYYIEEEKYLLKFNSPDISEPFRIKIVLQAPRGIILAAVPFEGVVLVAGEDMVGPKTIKIVHEPETVFQNSMLLLTASIDDTETGFSIITSAEYFINSTGPNSTGISMLPVDGKFDNYIEEVKANLNVTGWSIGNHTIYVHGSDYNGHWGSFNSLILNVVDQSTYIIYVYKIDMSVEVDRRNNRVRGIAIITVYNKKNMPVENANVKGEWSGSTKDKDSALTDISGKVIIKSDWVSRRWHSTFTFRVTDIIKNGWTYNPQLNNETSDTINYN